MATHTVAAGEVGTSLITLTADTGDTISFSERGFVVEIITDGTAAAWYTTDGTTPTVAGKNCFYLPASAAVDSRRLGEGGVVKIISAGTPTIRIQRD